MKVSKKLSILGWSSTLFGIALLLGWSVLSLVFGLSAWQSVILGILLIIYFTASHFGYDTRKLAKQRKKENL